MCEIVLMFNINSHHTFYVISGVFDQDMFSGNFIRLSKIWLFETCLVKDGEVKLSKIRNNTISFLIYFIHLIF